MWIARDENGSLFIYEEKPRKYKNKWESTNGKIEGIFELDYAFPEVKWEDEEPKELGIVKPVTSHKRRNITKSQINKDCVIISLKEYNDLKSLEGENERLKEADIYVSWGYFYKDCYRCDINGRILLSEKLSDSIRKIARLIHERANAILDKQPTRKDILKEVTYKIFKLPWYKRLWFKSKYIK